MLTAILQHTPVWVWGLLAALVALGLAQARDREASLARVIVLPVVLIVLSLLGVLSAFGLHAEPLGAWAAGVLLAATLGRSAVAVRGARWSAATGRLHLPGSWLPLGLILALFALKYGVGISLGFNPLLASDRSLAASLGLAYGVFSGLFLARALSLRPVVASGRAAPQPA